MDIDEVKSTILRHILDRTSKRTGSQKWLPILDYVGGSANGAF